MITILNCPLLTTVGAFVYEEISLEEARLLLANNKWQSAVGHEATAKILSRLLGFEIPANRIEYKQEKIGEVALIFNLKKRIPEGKILSEKEIDEIGYKLGKLTKIQI